MPSDILYIPDYVQGRRLCIVPERWAGSRSDHGLATYYCVTKILVA